MTIDEKSDWRKKHWNSLLMNYKKAPFFSTYSEFFESYYKNTTTTSLVDFIKISTDFFLSELQITPLFNELSALGVQSKKQELIVDLCKITKSDVFVFGSQGKDYADIDYFKENNLKCYFQEYHHPTYHQLWGEFKPYMSVLDSLFVHGAEKTKAFIFENNISQSEIKNTL